MFRRITALSLLFLLPFAVAAQPLIEVAESWKLLRLPSTTAKQPASWQLPAHDDAAWRELPAELNLWDSEDGPAPGLFADTAPVLMRRRFTVTDTNTVRWLALNVMHSTGFRAWLNGTEIAARSPVRSLASAPGLPVAESLDISAHRALLRNGENVLAIESPVPAMALTDVPVTPSLVANFTRGPFVQNVTTNSVVLVWRTPVPASSFVKYGTSVSLGQSVTNAALTTNHVIILTNLLPGARYYYQIGSADVDGSLLSAMYPFRTFKPSGSTSFLFIGDTGSATAARNALANVMVTNDVDLLLHGGDIIYSVLWNDASADSLVFSAYGSQMRSIPFYFTIGNHDIGCCGEGADYTPGNWSLTATNYRNAFHLPTNSLNGMEHFYSFDSGDAHFTCLFYPWQQGNIKFTNMTDQIAWLTNDLALSTKPWKILFFHSPVQHSGLHATRDGDGNGVRDQTEVLNALLPICQQHGVQLILNGHEHNFERFIPTNGVHSVVSGAGGYSLYNHAVRHANSAQFWPIYECLKFSITGDTLTMKAIATNGTVFDGLSITRATPPRRVWNSYWGTPVVESGAATDGDGNITGQTFDFNGTSIPALSGHAANLAGVFVNNDTTNLYIGFKHALLGGNQNAFLFVQSPHVAGVSTMAGLGNGSLDPAGEGVDGLDLLENLAFTNFTPAFACVLGDEFADGTGARSFLRTALGLDIGQGVFRLDAGFSTVPGALHQQFNRTPQSYTHAVTANGVNQEQNADFIEVAIPLAALGNPQPGDIIKIGAVVGTKDYNGTAFTRALDTGFLGDTLHGSGQGAVLLEGLSVRLMVPPGTDADSDGLSDDWELLHDLSTASGTGADGPNGDADGDGLKNSDEQLAGTHPRDAASTFKSVLADANLNRWRVTWSAVPGKRYTVEYATEVGGAYTPLTSAGFPRIAIAEEEYHEDDLSAQPGVRRFYRVRLVP